jgi:hypothetical protein
VYATILPSDWRVETAFVLVSVFIVHLQFESVGNCSAVAYSHNLQFTTARAVFPDWCVFTTRWVSGFERHIFLSSVIKGFCTLWLISVSLSVRRCLVTSSKKCYFSHLNGLPNAIPNDCLKLQNGFSHRGALVNHCGIQTRCYVMTL